MDPKPFKSHKENEKADLEARKLADVTYVGARKRKGRLAVAVIYHVPWTEKKASVRLLGSAPKK